MCEDELSNVDQKHDNLPGFEELRMAVANSCEIVGITDQVSRSVPGSSIELDYVQNGSGSAVQLEWDLSPKIASGCQLNCVCVWCSREFSHDGSDAELQPDSLGFMCPACKAKISGHFSVLDNGGSSG